MVKITSYTPSWLTPPAPGHGLFAPPSNPAASSSSVTGSSFSSSTHPSRSRTKPAPRRTIARRGTELFVANGRELRWGDLVYLKDLWSSKKASTGAGVRIKREDSEGFMIHEDEDRTGESFASFASDAGAAQGLRTIKTPVADDIWQLIISPQSNYLAVLTAHTVHVCLIPDSSHLTAQDTGPLKAKFWTLGPTTHVTSKAPVAAAVWHPLGPGGMSLVTVTEDAVVRLWELSSADRWSFDSPTLAIDLRKLADGTSLDQDFSASAGAMNKGFSPDSFDMEVASACFGGRGSGSWSSMTLWVAMRGGDVYALCPILPKRWAPPPTLIPSLSISVVSKLAAIENDPTVPPREKLLAQQQVEWMSDLDNQEARVVEGLIGEPATEIYTRPSRPGAIPRLQGPFDLVLDAEGDNDDLDVELTDIFVIGEKVDTEDLMMGENEDLDLDEVESEGLSLSIVCLVSTSGQLRICLDFEGVEAQWLPNSKLGVNAATPPLPSLLTFRTLDVLRPREVTPEAWPMISADATSRYSFFVTHPSGITLVSLASWAIRLEEELRQFNSGSGANLRIEQLAKGQSSTRERVYTHKGGPLAACVVMRDPDLGYFLVSSTPQQGAVALVFEPPEEEFQPALVRVPLRSSQSLSSSPAPASVRTPGPEDYSKPLVICEPRPPFQPSSDVFDEPNDVTEFLKLARTSKYRAALAHEMRLSPAALTLFTNAHQRIDAQTERVNKAVGELFRRLQLLPSELHEQVIKMQMLKEKIDKIAGEGDAIGPGDEVVPAREGGGGGERLSDDARLRKRLEAAQATQKALTERMDKLKRAMSRAHTRELSDKERAWIAEVETLEASLLAGAGDDKAVTGGEVVHRATQFGKRFEQVTTLKAELCRQAEMLQQQQEQQLLQQPPQEESEAPHRNHSRTGSLGGGSPRAPLTSSPNVKIPAEVRKAKIGRVLQLLERETTMVDAVKTRLERMSLA